MREEQLNLILTHIKSLSQIKTVIQTPAIISSKIENKKFIEKTGKFIVSFGRYNENYFIDNKTIQKRWSIQKIKMI